MEEEGGMKVAQSMRNNMGNGCRKRNEWTLVIKSE